MRQGKLPPGPPQPVNGIVPCSIMGRIGQISFDGFPMSQAATMLVVNQAKAYAADVGLDATTRALVRGAFAHRRKSLARSLEHVHPGSLGSTRAALRELGIAEDARAEALSPADFAALAGKLSDGE